MGHKFEISCHFLPLRFMLSLWNSQYQVLTTFAKRAQISHLARHYNFKFLMGSIFTCSAKTGAVSVMEQAGLHKTKQTYPLNCMWDVWAANFTLFMHVYGWILVTEVVSIFPLGTKRERETDRQTDTQIEREHELIYLFKNHQGAAFESKPCVFYVSNLFSSRLFCPLESE